MSQIRYEIISYYILTDVSFTKTHFMSGKLVYSVMLKQDPPNTLNKQFFSVECEISFEGFH